MGGPLPDRGFRLVWVEGWPWLQFAPTPPCGDAGLRIRSQDAENPIHAITLQMLELGHTRQQAWQIPHAVNLLKSLMFHWRVSMFD